MSSVRGVVPILGTVSFGTMCPILSCFCLICLERDPNNLQSQPNHTGCLEIIRDTSKSFK